MATRVSGKSHASQGMCPHASGNIKSIRFHGSMSLVDNWTILSFDDHKCELSQSSPS